MPRPKKMATPYVPVPMPIGNSASGFTASRNQRSSSFGSGSTSSNSSRGHLDDPNVGNFKQTNVQDRMDSTSSVCGSPLIRTKFTGVDSSIEYSARPRDTEEQHADSVNWEERPSTPTILGYEVMEERAKFTVSVASAAHSDKSLSACSLGSPIFQILDRKIV